MRLDVIGVGPLNLDLIVDVDEISDDQRQHVREGFESDRERITTDLSDWLASVARIPRSSRINIAQGGSAFNTIHALAAMNVGLALGYVGVAAAPPEELLSLRPELVLPEQRSSVRQLGIDDTYVFDGQPPGGLSLSLVEGTLRSLRTHVDLNAGAILASRGPDLARYFARARHLHVTSIAGEAATSAIADSIDQAKRARPSLSISVDPGELWVSYLRTDAVAGDAVKHILSLADTIFVNPEEMHSLAGDTTDDAADHLMKALHPSGSGATIIILKGVEQATAFAMRDRKVTSIRAPQRVLPPARISDATGAGDVFAAGVLAGQLSTRGRLAGSMAVGLSAARKKIQYPGDDGYRSLTGVVTLLDQSSNRGVFISHSFQDLEVAKLLVELLRGIGVPHDNIFCASNASTAPHPGQYLDPAIIEAMKRSALVILLVSDSFMTSEYCQYEVGAAWALNLRVFPIAFPAASFQRMSTILRSRSIAKLEEPETYGNLHDTLSLLGLMSTDSIRRQTRWEDALGTFIKRLRPHIASGPSLGS